MNQDNTNLKGKRQLKERWNISMTKYYKFLDENLRSYHDPNFYYPSPGFDPKTKKWIPTEWISEPNHEKTDQACGKGLHLMKVLIPKYQPYKYNCYEAEGKDLLGEDKDKARFVSIRLIKPVSKDEIIKANANLWNANLWNADLRNADLSIIKNFETIINPKKAYWNKFTKVNDDFKKLLSKDRFINE